MKENQKRKYMSNQPIRILWQSSTAIQHFPAYEKAIQAHAGKVLSPGSSLVVRGVKEGTNALHYRAFDFLNNSQVFDSVVNAEHEGCDAVAIGCFIDPILDELREIVDIPVMSMGETGMHLACMLGKRFSVLAYTEALNDKFYTESAHKYGLQERASPFVAFELPLEDLEAALAGDPAKCLQRVHEAGRKAVAMGAEVILLGCGVLNLIAVQNKLTNIDGATVLDVSGALMKMTEAMVVLRRVSGVSISRRGFYAKPKPELVEEVLKIYHRGAYANKGVGQ
jgi:Asp/Glu/hydantoin racemase